MPYRVFFTKYASRLLKKIAPAIQPLIAREIESIARDPYAAPQLKGGVTILRAWHAYLKGVPYRIVFEVADGTKSVLIHIIAKRSEVYKLVNRLFR